MNRRESELRRLRGLRVCAALVALLLIAIALAPSISRAATSAEVEREISRIRAQRVQRTRNGARRHGAADIAGMRAPSTHSTAAVARAILCTAAGESGRAVRHGRARVGRLLVAWLAHGVVRVCAWHAECASGVEQLQDGC